MPAGASPNIRPVRSVPAGKALQVGHPLHFLLAACGVGGGARGHLVATPSFLSSATVPVTSFNSCARNSFVTGRGVGSGSLTVLRNHPLFRSVLSPFPFWRGARQPLLLPGQQRIENVGGSSSSSWFYRAVFGSTFMAAEGGTSSIPSMSGSSSNRTSSSGDVDEDGGTGSTAPLKAGPGSPTASGGGGRGGGEAGGREDFPIVTMDPDAVQKFAEIEVWWGEWSSYVHSSNHIFLSLGVGSYSTTCCCMPFVMICRSELCKQQRSRGDSSIVL